MMYLSDLGARPVHLPRARAAALLSPAIRCPALACGDAAAGPRLDVDSLPPGWLAAVRTGEDGPGPAALRRAIEIGLALLVLALAAPLLATAALAARLDGPGPVLERTPRGGRAGRVFTLYRLRAGRIGWLMRFCRIAEVPQLLNVLKGEMALVGPRPEVPEAATEHGRWIPRWRDREVVRPGVTGWAQLHQTVTHLHRGGSVAEARRMLGYDLYYVRHRSLGFDLRILFATLRVVLFQEEAR